MMLRGLVIGLLCAAGCSKGESANAEAGGPAGIVVELSGSVQATRNGEARPLALDAEVFSDDTIKTAANSSVAIKLKHNNAALRLDADMSKRVDQSLAWKAPKQEGDSVLEGQGVNDQTVAAGRHTEHEAASTASNATADKAPAAASDEAPGAETAPAPAPPPTPAKAKSSAVRREKKAEHRPPPAPPKHDRPRDVDGIGTAGKRGGGGGQGAGRGLEGLSESAAPDAVMARRTRGGPTDVKKAVAAKIKVCHALLEEPPSGTVTAVVVVSAGGKIAIKSITGTNGVVAKINACTRKKIAKLALGAGASPGTYKIVVKLD